jgi:hypothetical protein
LAFQKKGFEPSDRLENIMQFGLLTVAPPREQDSRIHTDSVRPSQAASAPGALALLLSMRLAIEHFFCKSRLHLSR